jgi:hypothetical protein
MNSISFCIRDKVAFGGYPTQAQIDELEINGFSYFIDLTSHAETGVTPYQTKFKKIKYPIKDRSIPYDFKSFCGFLRLVLSLINRGEKIYIHCKGGHGRSTTVVSCILFLIRDPLVKTSLDALTKASESHNSRENLKRKWLPYPTHQSKRQRSFIHLVCERYIE